MKEYHGEKEKNNSSLKKYYTGNLVEYAEKLMQMHKHNMLVLSVVPMSGPDIMSALFINEFQKYKNLASRNANIACLYVKEKTNRAFEQPGLDSHPEFDSSWTPLGKEQKRQISDNLKSNLLFFQGVIRGCNAKAALEALAQGLK